MPFVSFFLSSGVIWALVGISYRHDKHTDGVYFAEKSVEEYLIEYTELFLFVLVAVTFIKTIEERGVFNVLKDKLISLRFSRRALFWVTGTITFFLSAVADNLTTALVMGTVIINMMGMRTPCSNKPTLYTYLEIEQQVKQGLKEILRNEKAR